MPYNPTEEQQRILDYRCGSHARVLAGPGTGKSATLVALVDRLMAADPPPRAKLLTFTRAATAELAKTVSNHPAAAALRPSTVHSFSISVLLRNRGAGDFPQPLRIADKWEERVIVSRTLARRINVHVNRLQNLVREMAAGWELLEARQSPQVNPDERARFVGAWHEHRRVYGYTLLAELPFWLGEALRNHADLEGVAYDLMVVDEYQDLNACDLEVLRLIADRGCSIIAAGDDDQSIYSFRYAAPEGILRFLEDYPGCERYELSVTQRCGRRIVEWASHVIGQNPGRANDRARLACAAGAPDGEVALLSFEDEADEARGIAALIQRLVEGHQIPAPEILVLMRGDHNGMFSGPIKTALDERAIAYSDPDAVDRMLAEDGNRRMLAVFRLLANGQDSLAWASLLFLTNGIGQRFSDFIYERANAANRQFGEELLEAYEAGFPGAPGSAARVRALLQSVHEWLAAHPLPAETPADGWGHWMVAACGGDVVPEPSAACAESLRSLDALVEEGQEFDKFLAQITPLGRDRALAESQGVRIMTMVGSKGLTVRATIIAALDGDIVPMPTGDLAEERRLLYVAMTRAKQFLFGTWALRRRGPTARAGAARVADRRRHSRLLDGGPVRSCRGADYLRQA